MKREPLIVVFLFALLGYCSETSHAIYFSNEVLYGSEHYGTFTIDTYETYTANSAFASDYWLGGVKIRGWLEQTKNLELRYIQAVQTESDTFRWINDSSLPYPQPFLDVPPGGHKVRSFAGSESFLEQTFDVRPWYDGASSPALFFDGPGDWMLPAKNELDQKLEWNFEAWLVCLVEEEFDLDRQARDDAYTVAPLLGWRWGYDIIYEDIGLIGVDEFLDFKPATKNFSFLPSPTSIWTDALGAQYGTGLKQDYWNIAVDSPAGCVVPEPSTIAFLSLGTGLLVLARRRLSTTGQNP